MDRDFALSLNVHSDQTSASEARGKATINTCYLQVWMTKACWACVHKPEVTLLLETRVLNFVCTLEVLPSDTTLIGIG